MSNYLDARGRPRIVVTGIGMMSPLGNSADESWEALINGRSGVARITQFDASHLPVQIAGEVKDFDPKDYMDFKEARRMSRCSQLSVAAATMALADAGLANGLPDPERAGTLMGTGVGGYEVGDRETQILRTKGFNRTSPFAMTAFLPNMPSYHISLLAGTQGPIATVNAACATGTQAIGEGAEFIRRGIADIVLTGGVEGLIHESAVAGFARMLALTPNFNDDPEHASMPFDKNREGFILSEGAGVVVLERLDHALARGAKIYAEFLGHASSSDAFHVAAQDPEAAGAVRAMKWAVEDAGKALTDIDYINAHGTSTPMNDMTETMAIKKLFGEHAYQIPVSSTKSSMGHAMGGTGAIEAIFSIYAINKEILPATLNYNTPDPECDLDYVPNTPRPAKINTFLSNSFGLGGQNACLVMGRYENHVDGDGVSEQL
ncbi:MAG: beta-ketoacyl-ACP synthase II [Anaerolineae bacterium]|nr:beta-ketoacyl-ACP synthase II [Anaerolineae bacterium]